jgi:hypothetical protein
VRGWRERFRREGVRALSVFGWKGGASRLTPAQEAELTDTLTRRLFPSTAAVMAHVEVAAGPTRAAGRPARAGKLEVHRRQFT